MFQHPKDRRSPLSRREFLRRAGLTGIAVPSLAAILAACGDDNGGGGGGGSPSPALQLARPDNPVTLPVTGDNPPIADGLAPEAGALLELNVIDEDLLGSGSPPRLLLRMVDDKSPAIDLKLLGGISSLITAQARIPGDLKVKDDFGVTSVGAGVRVVDDQEV